MSRRTRERGDCEKSPILAGGMVGNAVTTKLIKIAQPHFNLHLIVSNKQPT